MEQRQHNPLIPTTNRKRSLWQTMAKPGLAAGSGSGSNSAKAMVVEQISQVVPSISATCSTLLLFRFLEQMSGVISSSDAHVENGLQNVPHLKTLVQLLAKWKVSGLVHYPEPILSKRLLAGDSVLSIRDEKQQLLLGIKGANRQQPALSSSVKSSDSMHVGIHAAAAHAASNNSPFTIFYNPSLLQTDICHFKRASPLNL